MKATLGRVTAELSVAQEVVAAEIVDLINQNVSPPAPVSTEDVYVRAMYVVSDEVNSFGGCFPTDEHEHLCELLVDSPVLIGHRKDHLPVGRTFHAVPVRRQGQAWIKSYFYWLKNADGAANMAENIDGGIYKECSIGFTFGFPECSLCGADIRTCRHEPLVEYDEKDGPERCHFNYRQIERVLETSLVYRGANPDTSVSRDLAGRSSPAEQKWLEPALIDSPDHFEPGQELLVIPYYDGLPVTVTGDGQHLRLQDLAEVPLPPSVCSRFDGQGWPAGQTGAGMLLAYRGRERLGMTELRQALCQAGPASRLEVVLFPGEAGTIELPQEDSRRDRLRRVRHSFTTPTDLDECASRLATRDGVRVWASASPPPRQAGYRYQPSLACRDGQPRYCWYRDESRQLDLLQLVFEDGCQWFRLRQFHPARLARGARFVADGIEPHPAHKAMRQVRGQVDVVQVQDNGLLLRFRGPLSGELAIRPVHLDGRRRWLLYRVPESLPTDQAQRAVHRSAVEIELHQTN